MPGALDITWASPCGNRTMSPVATRTGVSPTTAPQHVPRVRTWYSITCSEPGITAAAISRAAGASATQLLLPLT